MKCYRVVLVCVGYGILLSCSARTSPATETVIVTGQSIDSLGLAQRVQRWTLDPEQYDLPDRFPVVYRLSESGNVTYVEMLPTILGEIRDSIRAAVMGAARNPPIRPDGPSTLWITLQPGVEIEMLPGVVSPPVVANREEFSEILREIGERTEIPGRSILWLLVASDGRVRDARIAEHSGTIVLDELLLQAAVSLRFEPATQDGVRVPVWTRLPMSLTIR